jgi:hypothetical protein
MHRRTGVIGLRVRGGALHANYYCGVGGFVRHIRRVPCEKRDAKGRENRWQLTKRDRDRVAAEIWLKSKTDVLKSVKRTASKLPPPVPYATRAERGVAQVKSKQHSETKSKAWRGFIGAALPVLGNLLAVAGVIGLSILWETSTRSTSTSHEPRRKRSNLPSAKNS